MPTLRTLNVGACHLVIQEGQRECNEAEMVLVEMKRHTRFAAAVVVAADYQPLDTNNECTAAGFQQPARAAASPHRETRAHP